MSTEKFVAYGGKIVACGRIPNLGEGAVGIQLDIDGAALYVAGMTDEEAMSYVPFVGQGKVTIIIKVAK